MRIRQPGLALLGVWLMGCSLVQPSTPDPAPLAPPGPIVAPEFTLPTEIADVTWHWVSLTTATEQVTVEAPERYTIQFEKTGRLLVTADCNRGLTNYTVNNAGRLALRPIALTNMECPEGSLSDQFAKAVGNAASYSVKGGELILDFPASSGRGTMRFRRGT